ncbi:SDR family oxidoreductase [Streptomyces sp. NPDC059639]|uniref:SDR family oxidoreductase n=1 Tax=Streptomyces sp. NPDC059639 TaxID=3346891 RepID=UPI003680126E
MSSHLAQTQVVIVGAGPVGLLLAGELRLGGADVVVLERRTAPVTESRASTLHARTMEILDSRGLLAEFGSPPNEPRGHFGGIPLDLTLPTPHPGQWKVPQRRTEEILEKWARSLGADLRRGQELCELSVARDHVEVRAAAADGTLSRWLARYVVGCDGENSTVRAMAGTAFPGENARRTLVRADVQGIDIPDRRFERLDAGLAVAARGANGVTRVMVHESRDAAAGQDTGTVDFAGLCALWRRVTGEDISGGTPLWINSFGDASRQAACYRVGRVLLAGDAAHQQMPIGGQALNLGLQDAFNLGWKLAATVGGQASEDLLDSYHTERHAVGRRILSNIRAQATLLLGGPEVEPVRAVTEELMAHPAARAHLAGMISGLDVRHDVRDGSSSLLGRRLPPAELITEDGARTTTTELLRAGRGLLLDLAADPELTAQAQESARPWGGRATVVTARCTTEAVEAGLILVRPDGHVAWAGHGTDGLGAALQRWFGPQEPTGTRDGHNENRRHTMNADATPSVSGGTGRLEGKTALVTGSSRGIGRATAVRLARDGALVAVHCSSRQDAAEETVATIEKEGGRAFAVRAELGVPGDVDELFGGLEDALTERTGSTRLDILVNNAGVMGGVAPEQTTPDDFDRIIAVNAKAPFFLIQRALENLPNGGRIINISSGLTRCANPSEIAYAMSKGAVEQLALHFARLLGPRRITINSVAPGITRNGSPVFDMPQAVEEMAGLSAFHRVGEPEDIADVVAFLASDEARWVTGSFVDATGGTLLG